MVTRLMKDDELRRAKRRLGSARASLACEGIHLTEEQLELFRSFEEQRLPHSERRRRLLEFSRAKRSAPVPSAAE